MSSCRALLILTCLIFGGCARSQADLEALIRDSTPLRVPANATFELLKDDGVNVVVRIAYPDSIPASEIQTSMGLRRLSPDFGKPGVDIEFREILDYFPPDSTDLLVNSGPTPTRWETVWSKSEGFQVVNLFFDQ